MKLTTVLLIAIVMQVSAGSYAQKISLSESNTSIQKVFDKIRAQSGYDFLFSRAALKNARPVSISVRNTELKQVLDQVFQGQPLEYTIIKKSVVVSVRETSVVDRVLNLFSATDIKGQVLDENGRPVNRASVKVKSTGKVVVTDDFGRFTINVPDDNAILVVSYVGYITKEVPVTSSLVIVLDLNQNKLEEMVVVGYGSAKRKDLTGSVASVDVNEIRNVPFATIDQALSGKAAGVQVVQADGSPGGVAKIRIRGGTSLLGGNDPLYIIDGVQMQIQNRYIQSAAEVVSPVESFGLDGGDNTISGSFARGLNSLGGLNINDIESIDILKDASATAIYGSRAANGVVIITTKKGRFNQKASLDANYYIGQSSPVKEKLLNRDQYIMILKEAAQNLNDVRAAYTPPRAPTALANSILNDPNYFGTANTDWLDLVLRNGITQNADLSLRGGGAGSRYYTSVTYNKNNGVVKGTDYTRLAGKLSLDNDINSKLRFNTNLDYGYTTNNITNGIYTQALFAPPTIEPYNADGSVRTISSAENGSYGFEGFQNPLALLTAINRANSFTLIGSLAGEYDILKELKFRSSVAVNYNNYRQTNYQPSTALISASFGTQLLNGIATQAQSQESNIFYENTLTWTKEFNENHRINVLGGTSWQISRSSSFSASGQGFPDDVYLNNLSSAATTLPATGLSAQNSLLSFYARANYSLFDKYIFTFTGRSDASSKFPAKNRVGYFPSGGVAWRISQENFLKDVKWINEIKLRASTGRTGTQNIGDNLFYTLYSPVSYAGLNGLSPNQLGNDQIKWESTLQKDAGIEFQLLNSRLHGEFGYYEKSTSGILFPATVASSSGFTGVTANLADINNRGLELQIGGDFIRHKNWQWSGTLNVSGNRSKVKELSNDFADPTNPKVYNYGSTVLKVGEPVGLFYGFTNDGLIRTQQELDEYKASFPTWASYYPYLGIGDSKYVIDPQLRFMKSEVIGHAEPKYYGGYTNNISYKNFTLTTLATFSYGGQISYVADIQNADLSQRTNKGVRILDRWTPDNMDASRPRLVLGQGFSYGTASSQNIYDASFIRLKSVTLNYQLSKDLLNRLKMNQASLYVSATNLFTVTNYPGADPETSNNPYSLIGGYSDSAGYPTVRQLSFGVRLGF
ncbi:tonB-dependent outer membrane receptor [Pedobacter sp. BAL39]|uniref:TonB-dependent receptor n=1 Tax=Pedobacter sp. BAL39 TaxID=391596 RepID=UPI000155AD63|nr:TonB-dependent receptor [Pedobacter sp. BAL39]EDM34734.1 tonB-dependent outer membrane receptor [Pedobacter sp. BAL39]